MKQKLLKTCLMVVMLLVGVGTTWGAEETIASFSNSSNSGWTITGSPSYSSSGGYQLVASTMSITTPNITFSNYSDITITITARKYGGPNATQGKISVKQGATELTTYSPGGTTLAASSALSINPSDGTLVISCPGASSSKGCGISSIVIKGTAKGGGSGDGGGDGGTITINMDKLTNPNTTSTITYGTYNWTSGTVSGVYNGASSSSNTSFQFNYSASGSSNYRDKQALYNTVAVPGKITSIKMITASGSNRSWTPYVSSSAITPANYTSATALTAKTVNSGEGTTWEVTGNNTYFYLNYTTGSASYIGDIVVTYETAPAGPAQIPNLIKTSSADLYVGDEIDDLNTYLNLPNDYAGTVTFSSTSEAVEIDDNYLLAIGAGKATINVTAGANGNYLETTGTITLTISKKTPVLSWDESKTSYTIFNLADNNSNKFVGQTATATEGATVKYAISGTDATIGNDGIVTITGVGTATVTASTEETDAINAATSITYTITVVEPSITMSPADGEIYAASNNVTFTGNGVKIDYVCLDPEMDGETNGTTITASGVTASGEFAVTIKDDADNSFTDEFSVTYLQNAGLEFNATELRVLVGSTEITEPTLNKATDGTVTYELVYGNPEKGANVATIDPVTGKLTLMGLSTETQGSVTVKATTPKTATYLAGEATYNLVVARKVTTTSWSNEGAAVTIDKDEIATLPTATNDGERNLFYESSNEEVAKFVDGALTFVAYGTTTITAKTTATAEYAATSASYELTFAPRYTVTFSINGEETELREETTGAGVVAPQVEDIEGKTFCGWVENEIDGTTDTKPSLVANAGKNLSENKYYYAVYVTKTPGAEGSVEFDLTTITDISTSNAQRTQTTDGITFTFSSVGDANQSGTHYVNMAKGSTLTQDAPFAGNIKSISFEGFKFSSTTNASMLVEGKKGTDGDYATVLSCGGSYTGADIDFSENKYDMFKITVGSERTVQFQKMTVEYSSVTYSAYCTKVKTTPTLSFAEATYEEQMSTGTTFSASIENPDGLEVHYSSSNEEVATVDEFSGEVTFVALGETTITATFDGNDEYEAVSASYVLTITPRSFFLTVTSAGYATLCLPYNAKKPESVQIFSATYNEGSKTVTLNEETAIKAGAGYVVKAEPENYYFTETAENVEEPENNHLVGVLDITELNNDRQTFIFAKKNDVVGFYICSGGFIDHNKAYLHTPNQVEGRTFIGFGDGDETAISTIESKSLTDGKFLEAGKIVIVKNGVKYNVNGQRMR